MQTDLNKLPPQTSHQNGHLWPAERKTAANTTLIMSSSKLSYIWSSSIKCCNYFNYKDGKLKKLS
jgi:hypothetical protein